MRRTVVANWKMHGTHLEGERRAAAVAAALRAARPDAVDVVLCPPFTALERVGAALVGTGLRLGAQDVFWEDSGPYTGEVSPRMLAALGCACVIVGHSERRAHLGETDAMVARKVAACVRHGLTPVLCVGESAEERAAGRAGQRLRAQLRAALAGLPPGPLVLAYEPVWAIGGGRAATPADGAAGVAALRAELQALWGAAAEGVPCLYGGSVEPANCRAFWEDGAADGVLVGGASLDPASFAAICLAAAEVRA